MTKVKGLRIRRSQALEDLRNRDNESKRRKLNVERAEKIDNLSEENEEEIKFIFHFNSF